MILPVPESKRTVKVTDTKYEAKSYGDLVTQINDINGSLSKSQKKEAKRFEDKTEDEMHEEMARKRKQ